MKRGAFTPTSFRAPLAAAFLATLSHSAAAQGTPPTPGTAMGPLLAPMRLSLPLGEPTGPGGTIAQSLVVLPLQLSLLGSVFPAMPGLQGVDCRAAAEASGNTIWGFSTQHGAYLPLTRRLTLHGFSQLGCATDSGMGGAATYLLPLNEHLALVGSAGFFTQPALPSSVRLKADAGVDLFVNQTPHPFAIGVHLRRQAIGSRAAGFSFTSPW